MIADSELLAGALRGDTAPLNALFSRYRPRVYALALRRCGNTPLAEDAVQDAFLTAYTRLDQLKDPAAFLPWLNRIVTNCCYQALRNEKRLVFQETLPELDGLIDDSVDQHLERMTQRDTLYTSLSRLSESLRPTMILRYLSDFTSYQQIAEIVGVPVGTVRSRLNEGRKQLTQHWNGLQHADETEYGNTRYWNEFYSEVFPGMYEEAAYFRTLLHHLSPAMQLAYTTGETEQGRTWLERNFRDDDRHGSRMIRVNSCISSGNLSVVQIEFANAPEHPNHCPPQAFFVTYRSDEHLTKLHVHPAPPSAVLTEV